MSTNAVGLFERGERFPRERSIEALALALQAPADELLQALLAGPQPAEPGGGITRETMELARMLRGRPHDVARAVVELVRATLRAHDDAMATVASTQTASRTEQQVAVQGDHSLIPTPIDAIDTT